MEDWQACSRLLFHILNYMGYCQWMIDARKQHHSELGKRVSIFISGSKGEGLTNLLQSDIDCLFFCNHICGVFDKDGDESFETEDPTRYMFKVERDWSPPGYCLLVLSSRPTQSIRIDWIERSLSVIDKSVFCFNASKLLDTVAETFRARGASTKPIAGPSQPSTFRGFLENDNVPTFSCPCSAELDAWYNRTRHHDWPSKSLQQDVRYTSANVVATGSKGSLFTKMQWRFCFNRGELKLMHSLNPTQTKVYVVLKMILKDHLKPANKEITSYVMKSIVLWMCEKNPSALFAPNTLLSWIYEGLQTLKSHIESGNLPYYMIPARNLLEGKFLDDATKINFLDKLSRLLESGASLVHVYKTIQFGLDLYNDGLLEDYGWKRNYVEVSMFLLKPSPTCVNDRFKFLRLAGINDSVFSVLLPDLNSLAAQGITDDERVKIMADRVSLFLYSEKGEKIAQYLLSKKRLVT